VVYLNKQFVTFERIIVSVLAQGQAFKPVLEDGAVIKTTIFPAT
jgi:hypothetical protein